VEAVRHRRRSFDWPKEAKSNVLSIEEATIIVAFRRHTLLPLDDCPYALRPTIPQKCVRAATGVVERANRT
jgi:hypothetical protein